MTIPLDDGIELKGFSALMDALSMYASLGMSIDKHATKVPEENFLPLLFRDIENRLTEDGSVWDMDYNVSQTVFANLRVRVQLIDNGNEIYTLSFWHKYHGNKPLERLKEELKQNTFIM